MQDQQNKKNNSTKYKVAFKVGYKLVGNAIVNTLAQAFAGVAAAKVVEYLMPSSVHGFIPGTNIVNDLQLPLNVRVGLIAIEHSHRLAPPARRLCAWMLKKAYTKELIPAIASVSKVSESQEDIFYDVRHIQEDIFYDVRHTQEDEQPANDLLHSDSEPYSQLGLSGKGSKISRSTLW